MFAIVAGCFLAVGVLGLPLVMRGHFARQAAHAEAEEFHQVLRESEPPRPATPVERTLLVLVAGIMIGTPVILHVR